MFYIAFNAQVFHSHHVGCLLIISTSVFLCVPYRAEHDFRYKQKSSFKASVVLRHQSHSFFFYVILCMQRLWFSLSMS